MRKSDIFESFAKIAEEKGLLSSDSKPIQKAQITRNAGTLTADEIAKLYGIKPDSSIKYDKNIMEAAHPDPVVISPSYDKLNGLVENEMERQNIILNILDDAPRGDGTVRKLAEKDLVLSLVRIANDLDSSGHQDLRALADACLAQTCKKKVFKKEAAVPLIAVVGLIAATLGAVWAHQQLPNLTQGLQQDYNILVESCDKLLNSNVDWGFGKTFDNEIKEDVQGIKDRATKFMETFNKYSGIIRRMEKPKDVDDVLARSQEPAAQERAAAIEELTKEVNNFSSYLETEKKNLSSQFYKTRHTTETGLVTSLLEKLRLQGGGDTFALGADVFQNIVNALSTFQSTIKDAIKVFSESKQIEEKVNRDEDLKKAVQNQQVKSTPSVEENKPTAKEKAPEEEIDELEKALSGGLI